MPFLNIPGLHGGQSASTPDVGKAVDPLTLLKQIFGSIHRNVFLNWKNEKILKINRIDIWNSCYIHECEVDGFCNVDEF